MVRGYPKMPTHVLLETCLLLTQESDAYKQYVFDNLINAKTKPEFIAGLDDLRSDLKGGKTFPTKR